MGLHYLPLSRLWDARLKWINKTFALIAIQSIFVISERPLNNEITRVDRISLKMNLSVTCSYIMRLNWADDSHEMPSFVFSKKAHFRMSSAPVVDALNRRIYYTSQSVTVISKY